jgi:hypothetical protein
VAAIDVDDSRAGEAVRRRRQRLDTDFTVVGTCIGRLEGSYGRVLDAICTLTGHLLWRSHNAGFLPPGGSKPVHTSHCRRCWRWGYVEGDYK